MILSTTVLLENNVYRAQVGVASKVAAPLTDLEQRALRLLGGFSVSVGGTFPELPGAAYALTGNEVVFPDSTVQFPSEFPVTKTFTLTGDAEAGAKAHAWAAGVRDRVAAGMTTLVSQLPVVDLGEKFTTHDTNPAP